MIASKLPSPKGQSFAQEDKVFDRFTDGLRESATAYLLTELFAPSLVGLGKIILSTEKRILSTEKRILSTGPVDNFLSRNDLYGGQHRSHPQE